MKQSPFDQEYLDEIFKFTTDAGLRLSSRENGRLEFNESWNLGNADAYGKRMAAFANSTSGYLVFGVADSPRQLIGLKNDKFDNLDAAKFTQILNSSLALRSNGTLAFTRSVERRSGMQNITGRLRIRSAASFAPGWVSWVG